MTTPERPAFSQDDLPFALLHRDAMMLVIDKPPGLPVHRGPAAKGRIIPVLTDHLDALRFGLPRRPEAAHRLDKDTSGCLVLGRHPRAMAQLNQLFRDGRIEKTYWAVVEGDPAEDAGLIDLALAKRAPDRGWWMKPDPAGLPSQTSYRVLGRGALDGTRLAWLALEPLTGRTHQLRVHCAASFGRSVATKSMVRRRARPVRAFISMRRASRSRSIRSASRSRSLPFRHRICTPRSQPVAGQPATSFPKP